MAKIFPYRDPFKSLKEDSMLLYENKLIKLVNESYTSLNDNSYSKTIFSTAATGGPFPDNTEKIKQTMKELREKLNRICQEIGEINHSRHNVGYLTKDELEFEKTLLVEAVEEFFDKVCGGHQVEQDKFEQDK